MQRSGHGAPFQVRVLSHADGFTAECLPPGPPAYAAGTTRDEALRRIPDAIAAWLGLAEAPAVEEAGSAPETSGRPSSSAHS